MKLAVHKVAVNGMEVFLERFKSVRYRMEKIRSVLTAVGNRAHIFLPVCEVTDGWMDVTSTIAPFFP
jgi:hypothetical protein